MRTGLGPWSSCVSAPSILLNSCLCTARIRQRPACRALLGASIGAVATVALAAGPARAQEFTIPEIDVQKLANGILALMGFQVIPDLTTSSLSIQNAPTGDPELLMSQLGAGFTVSDSFPLYLEGTLAFSRYDPAFAASNGEETRRLPARWNSGAVTVGVGWDLPLTQTVTLRPIANASLGYVTSDANVLEFILEEELGEDLDFIQRGSLTTYGYGGSLVLDYGHFRPQYEIDVELRYSFMHLESFNSALAVEGQADVSSLNLWARWRAPISDWTAFDRPVRYVLEFTHSAFLGDQRGVLGFDSLTSLGTGIELDASELNIVIDRARMMGRYVFGENVSGFSIGFAITF
jgi:hypothetical protein